VKEEVQAQKFQPCKGQKRLPFRMGRSGTTFSSWIEAPCTKCGEIIRVKRNPLWGQNSRPRISPELISETLLFLMMSPSVNCANLCSHCQPKEIVLLTEVFGEHSPNIELDPPEECTYEGLVAAAEDTETVSLHMDGYSD